jgi:hypothetical protein
MGTPQRIFLTDRANRCKRAVGEPGGARTRGPQIKSLMLYLLSYRPLTVACNALLSTNGRAPCQCLNAAAANTAVAVADT